MYKLNFRFLMIIGIIFSLSIMTLATDEYIQINPSTGYSIIINDEADLLTPSEEQTLAREMEPITAYGGVCFMTLNKNSTSAQKAAEKAYLNYFDNDSGVLLLIDMYNRQIWMSVNGAIYEVVTSNYCKTITDNVYKYATNKDYYTCASKAFTQVNSLLSGQKIAQPMKHISNGLLAVILAVLFNFWFMMLASNRWKRSAYGTIAGSIGDVDVQNINISKLETEKVYSPRSKNRGSSGGGRSSGGGGFSGGGGGHSF